LLLKPVEAESFYRQAIAEDKGTASIPAGNDAALRLAMVLEGQGRDREALEEIRKLAGLQDWSEADAATIELQRGILEVNQGFTRKGVRHIEEALSSFEGTDSQTWLRAKGRYTLALVLYSQAMKLDFDASDKKAARNLKKRAELMRSAEDQVLAVIGLNQVEWVLACLIALGDAYLDWGADLKAAKAPKGLSEAEAEIWRTEILRYASNAEKRALHAWEQGIELAIRLDFESTRTTELKTRINHLKQQQ
jgi:tetratricopeptide (TPR) repeat protein